MKYWIPSEMKIGKKKYEVIQQEQVNGGVDRGLVNIKEKFIRLGAKDYNDNNFSAEEYYETLFHEMTHAILYEMKNPLWRNEKFVQRFAKHLTDAIVSAK